MPLITCDDCGTEVSDAASACTKCGRPIAETKTEAAAPAKKRRTHPVTWLVLIAIVSVGAYKFYFSKETKQVINRGV